jgi:hypothetical protein
MPQLAAYNQTDKGHAEVLRERARIDRGSSRQRNLRSEAKIAAHSLDGTILRRYGEQENSDAHSGRSGEVVECRRVLCSDRAVDWIDYGDNAGGSA